MGQLELPAPLDEFKQKVDALCAAGQPNLTGWRNSLPCWNTRTAAP